MRERGKRERESSFSLLVKPQMTVTVDAQPDLNQEPGVSSGSPKWEVWAQELGPSSNAVLGASAYNCTINRADRTQIGAAMGSPSCSHQFNTVFHNVSPN